MIYFTSDYTEGAHERILNKLAETNMVQSAGYGEDEYCAQAREMIKDVCKAPEADVHFLVGGTQTNTTVISAALRTHQGVISAECGHISVHETGAIEAAGHKVLTAPSRDGKITADQVLRMYQEHVEDDSFEHTVQPKMVYISNSTEFGLIYHKQELEALHQVCRQCGLYLYMDGARMGYALAAEDNDLSLWDIARYCDVFYIGGTKCGALFGEAVVITNPELKQDFRYVIKQKGGMLAKGRLLGIQFMELFRDELYWDLSRRADKLAMELKEGFLAKGFKLYVDSTTNQQFPVIPNNILDKIQEKYACTYSGAYDSQSSIVRFCTSWATREDAVEQFLNDLKKWD
ncbi:MAG: low specificity L-threonine aldolase [Eubacteriales bacterium]|nr:low specificity L-threonine aldolase [Eubacteriales bacterium]